MEILKMKRITLVVFILAMFVPVMCFAEGMGEYSHGYRMGQLTKFSIKGLMMKSGEGQMLMGSESTPYTQTTGEGEDEETKEVNPWRFSSTNTDIQNKLTANIGEYVVLEYSQARIKSPGMDTEYEIKDVLPIAEPIQDVCVATSYDKGSKSAGSRVGRIVKASNRGTMFKSHEILIQQGNSGSQFKNMSISNDDALYDCAIKYLMAGQKVKITYSESFVTFGVSRDTHYDITKIEPVKGLAN